MKKIIILLLLLTSCKAKVTAVHTTDTIYKREIIKITKPQLNTIKIDEVCDSLGNLKTIFITNENETVKTIIKTIDNTLQIQTNIDSIINSKVLERTKSIKKETLIKYKTPKIFWYSLILNVLLLIFIFRKLLFVLK